MSKGHNICLDVGGTKVLGAIFGEKDQIIYRLKKRTPGGDSSADVEQVIVSVVEEMLRESGDAVAAEAVDRACHYLAIATGNMINALSPDLILYGGGVIEAMGGLFLQKILAEADR